MGFIKDQINEVANTFQRQPAKQYLLGFLYDSDDNKQMQIIRSTFQLYYKDETNPFQQLMINLVRNSIKGIYPDTVIDEVKYLKIADNWKCLIKQAKEKGMSKQEIEKYVESERFNRDVEQSANELVKKMLENNNKIYYVLVSTNDTEYQNELDNMYKKENAIKIKEQYFNIVLNVFDSI